MVEKERIRSTVTAASKCSGARPGAKARINQGAAMTTAAVSAADTHQKHRLNLWKSAARASPAAVSIGTNANTTLLINTELRVSVGPIATASESALLWVPSRCA